MKKYTVYRDEDGILVKETLLAHEVSDGYHTFEEIYTHRTALFVALLNRVHNTPVLLYDPVVAWKSKLHSDGSMFEGGYFVAGLNTPQGQISYHQKIDEWWDKFLVPEYPNAPTYDGHSSKDVVARLLMQI